MDSEVEFWIHSFNYVAFEGIINFSGPQSYQQNRSNIHPLLLLELRKIR